MQRLGLCRRAQPGHRRIQRLVSVNVESLLHCNVPQTISGTCAENVTAIDVLWQGNAIGSDEDVSGGTWSIEKTFVDTYGSSEAAFNGALTIRGTLAEGGTTEITRSLTVYSPAIEPGVVLFVDFLDLSSFTLNGSSQITEYLNKVSGVSGTTFSPGVFPTWSATALDGAYPGVIFEGTHGGLGATEATVGALVSGADPAYDVFVLHSCAVVDPPDKGALLAFANSGTSGNNNTVQFWQGSVGDGRFQHRRQTSVASAEWDILSVTDTNRHLLAWRHPGAADSTRSYVALDGEPELSEATGLSDVTCNRYCIGARMSTALANRFTGVISMVVAGAVSQAGRERIQQHIGARSGLLLGGLRSLEGFSELTDYALATGLINSVAYRQPAACSYTDPVTGQLMQVVAYDNYDDTVAVARRVYGSDEWEHVVTPFNYIGRIDGTPGVYDAHNAVTIEIDGSGYFWIFAGMHNVPIRRTRSAAPYTLDFPRPLGDPQFAPETTWQPLIPGNASIESSATYTELAKFANGDLLLRFRNGTSGSGDTILYRLDHASQTWTSLGPVIDTTSGYNAYPHRLIIDSQQRVHLAWQWKYAAQDNSRDIYYAVSEPNPTGPGARWYRDPEMAVEYTMPITQFNAEKILDAPPEEGILLVGGMTVDDLDRPAVATSMCFAGPHPIGDGVPHDTSYFVMRWNGAAWTGPHRVLPMPFTDHHNRNSHDYLPPPLLLFEPTLRRYHLFFTGDTGGRPGLWRAWAEESDLETWTFVQIFAQTLGQLAPAMDWSLWTERKVLSLYLQKAHIRNLMAPQPAGMLEVDLT